MFEILHSRDGDVDLASFLRQHQPQGDDVLAEVIELDGRLRLAAGKPVDLDRYLSSIPDLRQRPVPLDAAIDMTLRCLSGGGVPSPEAVRALESEYPDLSTVIAEAAQLAEALASSNLTDGDAAPHPVRTLPSELGPPTPDGRVRYRLLRALGRGAQGQVYVAEDRLLSEGDHTALVAIKLLYTRPQDIGRRARVCEEATKARRITHSNVVRVLDRGISDPGEDYVVYEFVPGGDLAQRIETRGLPFDPKTAAGIVSSVARGVQAAHVAGLVHCDLKPSNIVLDGEVCKVADFGAATRIGADNDAVGGPSDRLGLGNFAFISPEQYLLEVDAAIPSDIYALGGILYYLITGELPNGRTLEEVARRHDPDLNSPPPVAAPAPNIDRDLRAIWSRAMQRDPGARHQSAGELADDLDRWLRHEPIVWTRPGLERRAALAVRRHPRATVLMIVLLLIAATCALIGVQQWRLAQEQRIARIVQETRSEERRKLMLESIASTFRDISRLRFAAGSGPAMASTILVEALLTQWALGPARLGDVSHIAEAWQDRIRCAQSVQVSEKPQGQFLGVLLWESSLGFWLVSSHRESEALPVLRRNLQAWARVLSADDPWLQQLKTLEACALIRRQVASRAADGRPDRHVLQSAEELLRAEDSIFGHTRDGDAGPTFAPPSEGTALHQLVLETLVELYSSPSSSAPELCQHYLGRLSNYVEPTRITQLRSSITALSAR